MNKYESVIIINPSVEEQGIKSLIAKFTDLINSDGKVEKVTTVRVLGKIKRMGANSGKRADWKKAIVKLTADSKTIEFFDGMA